jgi:phosphoglycolate phosphatase
MAAKILINDVLLPDVRLAIFDKDGTLIDVHTYWANMVKYRSRFIAERLGLASEIENGLMDSMGVQVDQMRIKPNGPVGIKKREIVLNAGVMYLMSCGYPDHTALFHEAFREVDQSSLGRFDEIIRPIPGVHALFSALKAWDCKIALATTDISDRAQKAMAHLGMMGFVDAIVGADGVEKPKPDPGVVFTICDRLGLESKHCIMVGDAESDVLSGLHAGCLAAIGVETGLTPRTRLLELTPLVISDIGKIIVRGDQS